METADGGHGVYRFRLLRVQKTRAVGERRCDDARGPSYQIVELDLIRHVMVWPFWFQEKIDEGDITAGKVWSENCPLE